MHQRITWLIFISLLVVACDDDYYRKVKNEGYQEGYQDGKSAGYNTGYSEGRKNGHQTGLIEGFTEGYESGKLDGYVEGTQFLVGNYWSPTAGLGILTGIFLAIVYLSFKATIKFWHLFIEEKWVRYTVIKNIKQLTKSKRLLIQIQNIQLADTLQTELLKNANDIEVQKAIRQITLNALNELDDLNENDENLYISMCKKVARSKELTNQNKLDIYAHILSLVKQNSEQSDFANQNSNTPNNTTDGA